MAEKIYRICIDSKQKSSQAQIIEKSINSDISIHISKVYTLQQNFTKKQIEKIANCLYNPVVETTRINVSSKRKCNWVLELGFLPGVTDNIANTVAQIINDLFKINIGRNRVFSSNVLFISGRLTKMDVEKIAKRLVNTLIQRYHIKSYSEYSKDLGMHYIVPKVNNAKDQKVLEVDLNVSDKKLAFLGKRGIIDTKTGICRGPLALGLDYLRAIQLYYKKREKKATDIEIESIAQTWSEHCKHTIFTSQIDDIKEGIYQKYIKGATKKIREDLGKNDFCLSVFKDNSGGIIFDDEYIITDKAETHNSPSALDPFGGAITGIVGVNRDTIGFGLGALPIANKFGFCLGREEDKEIIYRKKGKRGASLSPKRIMQGVVDGVNVGGNSSGIPTSAGFLYFDDSYKGKPIVFVGTIGIIPRRLPDGRLSYEKKAMPKDNIVMIGGRVGKDGIHGATFSSEEMDEISPATAVQIGDPITQKIFLDAIVKKARDRRLYNSITDNGAGGLSCSVSEMAKECGGFVVELEKIPLKYPGLSPWEIWISESQERMTLSVPDGKLKEFTKLMGQNGVESSVIGKFNDTTKAVINFKGKRIFDLDMDFLHNGLPKKKLKTKPYPYRTKEPSMTVPDHQIIFEKILANHNNCSFEFISKQYDHEVQGTSVIKPLQGKGRVNGTAFAIKPLFKSNRGVVFSQALFPRLSEISCYDMAACTIDTAIRNCIALGGDIDHMALLDNFCWCSANDPSRLMQLKDAARACYDYATIYKTPFISGKDSMYNDFIGFDSKENSVKVSILPTLMISSISVIEDLNSICSMDFKVASDIIYLIGKTKDELGG